MHTFGEIGEKINASTVSGKEIAGLKKKKMKNNYDYDGKKSRKSEFSRGELRARRKSWGICIARYWPVDYC